MNEGPTTPEMVTEFPSVDERCPVEQGGTVARIGFSYQDEVAVSFFIEMLSDPTLVSIHCETHDDILLVRAGSDGILAEFVQVKGGGLDKLWSVADLCRRESGVVGRSIYEASLARDAHRETSLFRVVTLRPVASSLEVLTFVRGKPGREPDSGHMRDLIQDIESRCPGARSAKGNGAAFWLDRCLWDVRYDQTTIARANELALLKLAAAEQRLLLPEQADTLLEDLRRWAKAAGQARWNPDRALKIITHAALREWWERRTDELREGASSSAGGKLAEKLREASVGDEIIALAVDLRRDYAAAVRNTRYMADGGAHSLQGRVKSELMTLRARYAADQIDVDGVGFHALCLERLDAINNNRPAETEDQAAFLKGCMYDIADRCLHRFARPAS